MVLMHIKWFCPEKPTFLAFCHAITPIFTLYSQINQLINHWQLIVQFKGRACTWGKMSFFIPPFCWNIIDGRCAHNQCGRNPCLIWSSCRLNTKVQIYLFPKSSSSYIISLDPNWKQIYNLWWLLLLTRFTCLKSKYRT